MLIEKKINKLRIKTPLRFWLLAGASSVAIAGVVVTLSTRTVQADALLTRPASTVPSAPPVLEPTPETLTQQKTIPMTAAQRRAYMLHGIASWYGSIFNGRHTASGERFDMYAMTACHPTLPFGSMVRVINPSNHHSVVVRITDRGDLLDGRVIDLSYAAAQKLAITKEGIAKVDLEVLSLGHRHLRR